MSRAKLGDSARPAVEPNPLALLPGDYPEAIMLDFDEPFRPQKAAAGLM